MDTPDAFRLETKGVAENSHRETDYRRDYSERDKQSLLDAMSETFGSDKEAWNDLRRRERMAQAMYEC
jgi:hypothetical protein